MRPDTAATLFAALALLLFSGGCAPLITPELVRQLKDDHSSITVETEVNTPWGPQKAKLTRTNPAVKP